MPWPCCGPGACCRGRWERPCWRPCWCCWPCRCRERPWDRCCGWRSRCWWCCSWQPCCGPPRASTPYPQASGQPRHRPCRFTSGPTCSRRSRPAWPWACCWLCGPTRSNTPAMPPTICRASSRPSSRPPRPAAAWWRACVNPRTSASAPSGAWCCRPATSMRRSCWGACPSGSRSGWRLWCWDSPASGCCRPRAWGRRRRA